MSDRLVQAFVGPLIAESEAVRLEEWIAEGQPLRQNPAAKRRGHVVIYSSLGTA